MPRVRVVLQSRLTSSRLPGKAMLGVAGRPTVVLAAQRAGSTGAEVVVATSDRREDDVIDAAVRAAGVSVVRGPLEDPLGRFELATADLGPSDVVVRLTADNVVPDGALIDLLAAAVGPEHGRAVYARFGGDDPAVPYGVAGEAFTVGALREAAAVTHDPVDREHVTGWIRRRYGDLRLEIASERDRWAGARCTVDTFDDYVQVARLFAEVSDPLGIGWTELCDRLPRVASPSAPPRPNSLGQGRLVLGTVQLGVGYGAANANGLPSAGQASEVLDAARRCGITHLDTARAYGISEDRIGTALARGLSESTGVVTKVAPLDDLTDDAASGWGTSAVQASLEASLRALRTSSVAALLTHRARDWHLPGVREALIAARDSGRAGAVGVSLATPEELLQVLDDPACGYVQLPFHLLDRRWLDGKVTAALTSRPDVIVTVRSAYLQGLLSAGTEASWPTNIVEQPEQLTATLDDLVAELGRSSRADLALAYVLGHDWVTSVVVGAETPAQVHDTARLCAGPPLTTAEIDRVREALPAGSDTLLDPSTWRR